MILIKSRLNEVLVWNKNDIDELRTKYRIVGKLVGSHPSASRQNQVLSIPFYLTKEEITLLVEKDLAQLYEEDDLDSHVTEQVIDTRKIELDSFYEKSLQQQIAEAHKLKTTDIIRRRDEIIAGMMKRKPESSPIDEADKQQVIDRLIADIKPLTVDNMLVQQFTECLWRRPLRPCSVWTYPGSEQEQNRYLVYKHLWGQGYYLTYGAKFGGDYLVYPGDPDLYHAKYIAVVHSYRQSVTSLDIVQMARLASNVKKSVLHCTVTEDQCIIFREIKYRLQP